METAHRSHKPRWHAISIELGASDPLQVARVRGDCWAYFEQAALGQSMAAFGAVAEATGVDASEVLGVLAEVASSSEVLMLRGIRPPAVWIGGLAFDSRRPHDVDWQDFPATRWSVPQLLVWRRDGLCHATAFEPAACGESRNREELQRRLSVAVSEGKIRLGHGTPLSSTQANRGQWQVLVSRALEEIESGSLQKVVVARRVELESETPIDPLATVAELRRSFPECQVFCLTGANGSAFVGATPELLCEVDDLNVKTEALAGTASAAEASSLLTSDKNGREHRLVVEGIVEALEPLCAQVKAELTPRLRGLRNLVHLLTPIEAVLRPGVSVAEVVLALQPTPAVGGVPREGALAFLAKHELFDRGWYTGAVGWQGARTASMFVALRAALIRGHRATLFVGAGLVAGSEEESEWRETETKSRPMVEALGAHHV